MTLIFPNGNYSTLTMVSWWGNKILQTLIETIKLSHRILIQTKKLFINRKSLFYRINFNTCLFLPLAAEKWENLEYAICVIQLMRKTSMTLCSSDLI